MKLRVARKIARRALAVARRNANTYPDEPHPLPYTEEQRQRAGQVLWCSINFRLRARGHRGLRPIILIPLMALVAGDRHERRADLLSSRGSLLASASANG